nr:SOS response-associated peptidase family protein [Actinomyces urinae]
MEGKQFEPGESPAQTYLNLAQRRTGEEAAILQALADAETRHIEHWTSLLGEHAHPAPKPTLYSRILARFAATFGSIFILALAQRAEQRQSYDVDQDATDAMAADEHIHGEVVRGLAARSRARIAGTFRAAVFGANDGLVSNLALILGIAATGVPNSMVITTGIAGLLAFLSAGEGDPVMGFAGIYEAWQSPRDEWLLTFAIITQSAPDALGHIHDRSPVVVPPDMWNEWLDPATETDSEIRHLMDAISSPVLVPRKVGKAVGNVRNNDPSLVEPQEQ